MRTIKFFLICISFISIICAFSYSPSFAKSKGPSFNCDLARTDTEKSICANDKLSSLDLKMGNLYNDLRKVLPDDKMEQLRIIQRNWIEKRNNCGGNTNLLIYLYSEQIGLLEKIKEKNTSIKTADKDNNKKIQKSSKRKVYAMDQLRHIPSFVSCLIALALIFWGLRFFKLYIILIGVGLGGLFGATVGGLISQSQEGIIIGALILAIVGGAIAWPLQKLFVFLISGILTGLLGIILSVAIGVSINALIIVGIILFIIGGIIAIRLYDYFIIIVMAFGGAQSIFNIVYDINSSLSGRNISHLLQELIRIYVEHIFAFLFVITLFVLFAIYFQKVNAIKDDDDIRLKNKKIGFRKASYLFAFISLTGYALSVFTSQYQNGYIIFGVNLISWPIIAILTSIFVSWLNEKGYKYSFTSNIKVTKLLYIAIFGITLIPFFSWSISSLMYFDFQFSWFLGYFYFFIYGPSTLVVFKWIFSLIIFPTIAYVSILKSNKY